MECIPSLPSHLSQALLQYFCPQNADKEVIICRLYFGKEASIKRTRFNSRNFLIDLLGRMASICNLDEATYHSHDYNRTRPHS